MRLTDLGEREIAALRSMSSSEQAFWFFRQLDRGDQPYTDLFVRDVVDGTVDAKVWGRGGLIVPSLSLDQLLTTPGDDILDMVQAGVTDPVWEALDLDQRLWDSGTEEIGAPGVRRDDLSFDWQARAGTVRIWTVRISTTAVTDPRVQLRRWIASRLAQLGRSEARVRAIVDGVEAPAGLSPDARVAIAALQVESASAVPGIPGFRGADALYEN